MKLAALQRAVFARRIVSDAAGVWRATGEERATDWTLDDHGGRFGDALATARPDDPRAADHRQGGGARWRPGGGGRWLARRLGDRLVTALS